MKQKYLHVFDFEGKRTRIVMKDGAPWWVGKDVCDILGYANSRDALEKHCKHREKMSVTKRDGQNGGAQFLTIIPESDVYRLIIRSNMPAAERFEAWVMEEVLPSIRKHGAYMTPQTVEKAAMDSGMIEPLIQALKKEQEALRAEREKAEELEAKIEGQQAKVFFAESLRNDLDSQNTILIGGFRKIVREDDMLFIWLRPSSKVKGFAPLSADVEDGGEPRSLCLTYGTAE